MVQQTQIKQISGWEWKKLGELVDCLDNQRVPLNSKERELRKGDIPYYGANGQVDSINDFIFDEELLLFAEDGGSWGHKEKCTYIIKGKSWVNNHVHVLRAKENIILKFLEFYLNLTDLKSYISGTTRGKLNQKRMNDILIPVPPLEVQKQIVVVLGRAETLKLQREKINNKIKDVISSIFADMFGDPTKNGKGYPVKTLEEISVKINDGTHFTPKYTEGGIPFLRVTDITQSNESKKFISEEEHKELIKRCKPEKGDILYTKNGTIGIAKTVDWDYDFSIFVSLCLIKPKKEEVLSKYLEVFLNTPFALSQAMQHSKKGTITNLHLIEIKKILVPVPPIKKQQEFLKTIEKVETIMKYQIGETKKVNVLFDALVQKAFNGEIK